MMVCIAWHFTILKRNSGYLSLSYLQIKLVAGPDPEAGHRFEHDGPEGELDGGVVKSGPQNLRVVVDVPALAGDGDALGVDRPLLTVVGEHLFRRLSAGGLVKKVAADHHSRAALAGLAVDHGDVFGVLLK
jgi:hypothetical protein